MIAKRLRSIDMFGSKVTLAHNGATTFKTIFGAILTLIALGLMGFYIFLLATHQENYTITEANTALTTSRTTGNNSSKFAIFVNLITFLLAFRIICVINMLRL